MDNENDKLVKTLNQIKHGFEKNLEAVASIKQESDANILPLLEEIERRGWQTVIEIEDLQKKINRKLTTAKGRNTILFRMKSSSANRTKTGNY